MPRLEVQDFINLYIQESRNEGILPSKIGQRSWIEARLALEKYENGLGFESRDSQLVQDWELFKEALI